MSLSLKKKTTRHVLVDVQKHIADDTKQMVNEMNSKAKKNIVRSTLSPSRSYLTPFSFRIDPGLPVDRRIGLVQVIYPKTVNVSLGKFFVTVVTNVSRSCRRYPSHHQRSIVRPVEMKRNIISPVTKVLPFYSRDNRVSVADVSPLWTLPNNARGSLPDGHCSRVSRSPLCSLHDRQRSPFHWVYQCSAKGGWHHIPVGYVRQMAQDLVRKYH